MMDELLTQWRALWEQRQAATHAVRQRILDLQTDLAEIETPYNDNLAILEKQISAAASVIQTSYKAAGVHVLYRNGYDRVTWDNKALDGYSAAHPEILPFRKVTSVAPSVTIKAL